MLSPRQRKDRRSICCTPCTEPPSQGSSADALTSRGAEQSLVEDGQSRNRAGVRFCVLLHGTTLVDDATGNGREKRFAAFREDFVVAIATAAEISPSRVRLVSATPPIDFGAAKCSRAAPESGSVVAREQSADTGAGVLRFLGCTDGEDEAVFAGSLDALSESTASFGRLNPVAEETNRSRTYEGNGVTRVLAAIREPDAVKSMTAPDAKSAAEALSRVVDELADPTSVLQELLRPWRSGRPARFFGPSGLGFDRSLRSAPVVRARQEQSRRLLAGNDLANGEANTWRLHQARFAAVA